MRILFVGMAHSIHTVRWIGQVMEQGWDVHLLPVEDGLHPALRGITVHESLPCRPPALDRSVRLRHPLGFGAGLRAWIRARTGAEEPARDRAAELARVVRRIRPDVVHSLEMLKAGALVRRARTLLGGRLPPWAVGHWGSELFLLGREPVHRRELEAILAECDFFGTECQRDVMLAQDLGYRGPVLPLLPVPGGLDLERAAAFRAPGPSSSRRWVALKGCHGWAGRALVALAAFERCAPALAGYRVAIHSADPPVVASAAEASRRTGVPIDVLPASPHEEILRLHGRSRVSIGLSISDGMSSSLTEALAMGSFPVQSNTCCAGEWLRDGETALFVPPEDPEAVARALRRALTDDSLVDRAAEANDRLVRERLDAAVVRPQVVAMYARVVRGRSAGAKVAGP